MRELRERGYEGGYTAVTDVLREIRPAPLPAFEIRFKTPPGDQAQAEDWLGRWAMEPNADHCVDAQAEAGLSDFLRATCRSWRAMASSKSAASRQFVALSAERLAVWMASDLSKFDPLIIQIDGLRIGNDQVLGLRSARERRQTSARLTFRGLFHRRQRSVGGRVANLRPPELLAASVCKPATRPEFISLNGSRKTHGD